MEKKALVAYLFVGISFEKNLFSAVFYVCGRGKWASLLLEKFWLGLLVCQMMRTLNRPKTSPVDFNFLNLEGRLLWKI